MTIAIIPAAGSSSRFRELGKHYAKTVLPFQGRPIISHIVDRIVDAKPDIYRIIIVANNVVHMNQIYDAIQSNAHNKICRVIMFNEESIDMLRGPAKTIMAGVADANGYDLDVLIHLSDSLFSVDSIKAVLENKFSIGVQSVSNQSRWCIIDDNNSMTNKPSEHIDNGRAVSGLYRINMNDINIDDISSSGTESQISDIIDVNIGFGYNLVQVDAPIEYDFGTIEEYIANRGINKSRSFNIVTEYPRFVNKTTDGTPEHDAKLRREVDWYMTSPLSWRPFQPAIYDIATNATGLEFSMEKLKGTNLRDMALYLDRSFETWDEIFRSVEEMIKPVDEYSISHISTFWDSIRAKTYKRMGHIVLPLNQELIKAFVDDLEEFCESGRQSTFSYIHGDLHFANMFYDQHYRELKVIDPRGDDEGSVIYDLAKLNHSVNGNYDCIDAELYYIKEDGAPHFYMSSREGISKAYDDMIRRMFGPLLYNQTMRDINLITASLFISMVPLHSHNPVNQQLFIREFEHFYRKYKS